MTLITEHFLVRLHGVTSKGSEKNHRTHIPRDSAKNGMELNRI